MVVRVDIRVDGVFRYGFRSGKATGEIKITLSAQWQFRSDLLIKLAGIESLSRFVVHDLPEGAGVQMRSLGEATVRKVPVSVLLLELDCTTH